MAVRETTQELYRTIRKDYAEMSASGRYRSKFIVEQLAKKYFKSPATIENIVYAKA